MCCNSMLNDLPSHLARHWNPPAETQLEENMVSDILLTLAIVATGLACFGLFFKMVNWFENI